jgi:hypothetical protein
VFLALVLVGCCAAPAQAALYWSSPGTTSIGRAKLDGSESLTLLSGPAFGNPTFGGIAVDADHVYWTWGDGIGRANLDGTEPNKSFISGIENIQDVAVRGNHLYWSGEGKIGRANVDGSGLEPNFITGIPGGSDPGVVVTGEYIYWTNFWSSAIGRAKLDGSGVQQEWVVGTHTPMGLTADSEYLYWAITYENHIGRVKLDGTGLTTNFITSGLSSNGNEEVGVAVDGHHIYWANPTTHTVGRAELNGTKIEPSFISSAGEPLGITIGGPALPEPPAVATEPASAVTETEATLNGTVNPNGAEVSECNFEYGTSVAYGSTVPCTTSPESGTTPVDVSAPVGSLSPATTYHFRISATNTNGTETSEDAVFTTSAPPVAAALYWSSPGTTSIFRANLDGSESLTLLSGPAFGNPTFGGIAVGANHIYWTWGDGIGRANLDGTEPNKNFISGIENIQDVAVRGDHLYWSGEGKIGRANLDGTRVEPNFITGIPGGSDPGVVVTGEYIYWTNFWSSAIGRAKLDGSEVQQEWVVGTHTPMGLTADSEYLYWAITYENHIGRVKLDGTGLTTNFITSGLSSNGNEEVGVAVYRAHIYWANPTTHTIGRAELNGGEIEPSFISGAGEALGITVRASTLPEPLTVVTEPASAVTETEATLNGTVNPNGAEVSECNFEYGTSVAYGSTVPCTGSPGSGTTPVDVSTVLGSLSPATTYHFRISATNTNGTETSEDATFTTLPEPPVVVTEPASGVIETGATLRGTVNGNGGEVTACRFEYGTTANYGSSVACSTMPGSSTSPVAVSAEITGLSAETTYHYRIVATNAGGTGYGSDQTLTTALHVTTKSLPPATRGAGYSYQLEAGGGIGPYKWAKGGPLPKGLKLSNAGLLSGAPKSKVVPGEYAISVKVKDATKPKETANAVLTLHVS